ncbi:unnamed protein product, partial [Mesorhabditis spiculigera]
MDFYAYHLFKRNNQFNPLHCSCKLFQQWLVDSWVKIEQNRLDFLRKGQKPMRLDTVQGLRDHQNDPNATGPSGQRIILSAKHQGSPRNMKASYQDAMAMVARYGKPDLFLTFTANPNWAEIVRELYPGQTALDRPDLVERVFMLKMAQLDDELCNQHVLGRLMAYVSVIEFQKRGLPHRHMLLWLTPHWKLRTAGDVDHLIQAELPEDPNSRLYAIVTKCMMHRACGLANPDSPCMKDGECSKGFPKQYQQDTVVCMDSYPKYRRRNDGRTVMNGGVQLDNRHVVPYNPYLLQRFDAHINLEICAWFNVVKYLFKYCYKGTDRARICLQMGIDRQNPNGNTNDPNNANEVVDEIKQFIDARFVGPNESVHRILGMKMDAKSDVVKSLIVHLEDYQPIVYDVHRADNALRNAELKNTTLTAWFQKNKDIRELEEELGALPANILDARTIFYVEMPEFYTFCESNKKWNQRKRLTDRTIGRIHNVSPKDHEAYALRVLLLYRKGIEGFEDLRTINGTTYRTYVEAARAAGYLQDDGHNRRSMLEAANYQMPDQLRSFFAMLLVYCEMSDGIPLWHEFKDEMMADYVHRGLPANVCESKAYWDLADKLAFQGLDINKVLGLDIPQINGYDAPIDREAHRLAGEALYTQLNDEQKRVADAVMVAIDNPQGQCYFIDGPGGSGKTFVYTCINHLATSKGRKVDCVAWTGIAANLLPGGRTVNATFKLNVKQDNKTSTMKRQSKEARLLAATDVFIWDEAPMAPSHALEAVDALLKDITQTDQRFGGKIFLLGGDFRQVLPVVERGSRGDQVAVCLRRSTIWPEFVQFTLTRNMRVQGNEAEWKDWVLKVGNDEIPKDADQNIEVPPEIRSNGDLVHEIFGPIIRNGGELADAAILCPKNQQALETNNQVLELLPGELHLARSIDEAITSDPRDAYHFTTELMNSMTPTGLPPHELFLKVGAIVMLLRNLDVQNGLCNGTRLIVEQIQTRVLLCRFATGSRKGKQVLIPRIDCQYEKNIPFTLKRRQFPIRPSFAMTINKSQGQSFERVGLDLSAPIFAHGQAYVAISRCKSRDGMRILAAGHKMANVVYREVLTD